MKTFVISLGGSIVFQEKIDIEFLKKFKHLLNEYIKKGYKFIVYIGGGKLARNYQDAYKNIIGNNNKALDWIGISATHMNAFLLKTIFNDMANDEIISDPTKDISFEPGKNMIIAGGWKPGWSTDYDAVVVARKLGIDIIVNMSNIDQVYTKDPKKNPEAKPISSISWENYRKMVGDEWNPGLNAPFDPIASKLAQKNLQNVYVIGKNIENLKNVLDNKEFFGTRITS